MNRDTSKKIFTLAQLARCLDAQLIGDGDGQITGVNSLDMASETEISFVLSLSKAKNIASSKALALITDTELGNCKASQLIVENANIGLIAALNLFAPEQTLSSGIHPAAVLEENAIVGADVSIGAGAYISHDVTVGDGTIIASGCHIGENSSIGKNCHIDSNVVVYHNCRIGNNCMIQANTTIGSVGFGYYFIEGEHRLIPHNGSVVIEDCVNIGANCCIDRAKFGNTIIGAGTKIDNLVQIAHNVVIGKCCLIVSQAGIAGSSSLGDGVVLAGQSGIADHIKIGDGVMIGSGGGVIKDTPAGKKVIGFPARDLNEQLRIYAAQTHLPDIAKQLKQIAKKVEKLEAAENNK